jgi:predicted PurR-regulated permease PerM
MRNGSVTASPMRFLPTSRARIRPEMLEESKLDYKSWTIGQCRILHLATVQKHWPYMALVEPSTTASKNYGIARTVLAGAALIALLYFGRNFFITLIISAVFAFILDPAVLLVMKMRVPRALATAIVIGFALLCVYVLGVVAWGQIATIKEDLPTYSTRVGEIIDAVNARFDDAEKKALALIVPKNLREQQEQIQQKPQEAMRARRRRTNTTTPATATTPAIQEVRVHVEPKPVIGTIYGYVANYLEPILMASFIPFLVYFMLSWRDHINRRFLLLFPGENRYVVGKSWSHIGESTRAFVLGNFLLWVFLSSVSAFIFFVLELPYWPLVGLLSAFFSLVPYVGLPLSLIPPALAGVAVPNKFKIVITAVLITAGLHVICMNFLYAKVVGRRVRLNPLVVTIAMMFWGLLWGAVGLVLAIPITAGIKAVCDNVESLEPLGRLLGDDQD